MSNDKNQMDSSLMSIDEIKAHLRKDYSFWNPPRKSDRLFITESQWNLIDWTQEEIFRNITLPHKMWNMRHDDFVWPLKRKWRGEDAYGYRAPSAHPRFMQRLPQLMVGRGVARWMANGDASVVEVPEFANFDKEIRADFMPETIEFIERKCGDVNYGKSVIMPTKDFLKIYAPSALQKFSKKSYLKRDPYHISYHKIITKREDYCTRKDGPDKVMLFRSGFRWDSNDSYFRRNAFYIGLAWN